LGLDFLQEQRIEVRRIAIGVGVDQSGQVVNAGFACTENMKIYVVPGKMCVIEVMRDGKKTVRETPITQFGWEYELI
jgi:hypothetical protein